MGCENKASGREEECMNDTEKKYYKLLKDYSKTINSNLNDTEILKMITENFTKALNVKGCTVYLLLGI